MRINSGTNLGADSARHLGGKIVSENQRIMEIIHKTVKSNPLNE